MQTLAASELIQLLHDSEPRVQQAASLSLVTRGRASIEALLDGLQDPSAKVRAICALLLDHVADDRCVERVLLKLSVLILGGDSSVTD